LFISWQLQTLFKAYQFLNCQQAGLNTLNNSEKYLNAVYHKKMNWLLNPHNFLIVLLENLIKLSPPTEDSKDNNKQSHNNLKCFATKVGHRKEHKSTATPKCNILRVHEEATEILWHSQSQSTEEQFTCWLPKENVLFCCYGWKGRNKLVWLYGGQRDILPNANMKTRNDVYSILSINSLDEHKGSSYEFLRNKKITVWPNFGRTYCNAVIMTKYILNMQRCIYLFTLHVYLNRNYSVAWMHLFIEDNNTSCMRLSLNNWN